MSNPHLVVKHYAVVGDYSDFPSGVTPTALSASVSRTFLAAVADAGFGSTVCLFDDADAQDVDLGDILTVDVVDSLGNQERAFAYIFREGGYVKIAGKQADQTVTLSGPGILSILSDGRVQHPGGEGHLPEVRDVVFDWTHIEYDDSGWSSATEVTTVEAAQVPGGWGFEQTWTGEMPQNAFTGIGTGTTQILWASDGTVGGTTTGIGTCYFRQTFSVSAEPDGGHILHFTCDNYGTVYIDGKELCTAGSADGLANPLTSGFRTATIVPVELSIGDHVLAIKATNREPFGAPNPGGIACTIFNPDDYPFDAGDVIFQTTSSMKIAEYEPEPPGMSVGMVLRLFIESQVAIGRFDYISLDFTDDDDSDGDPWDTLPTISVKVGADDGYSLVQKIIGSYADVRMTPDGWTLQAWNKFAHAPASGVTYNTANLLGLSYKTEDLTADELLILSGAKRAWSRIGSNGRREGFLELGSEDNPSEVLRQGNAAKDIYGGRHEQVSLVVEITDDDDIPWLNANYTEGSTVTAPARTGGTLTEQALELGLSFTNSDEKLVLTVSVQELVVSQEQRTLQRIRTG